MKQFKFPLASVAVVREAREALRREVFAGTLRQAASAEQALAKASSERSALAAALGESRAGTFRPITQVAGLEAQRVAEHREREAVSLLQKARQAVDIAREDWLGARRGVRLLEQLKVRARARHQVEILRAEQREQDDRRSGSLWPVGSTLSEP